MGWTIRGSNLGGSEIFHAVQTGPKAQLASCTTTTCSLYAVRRPELGAKNSNPSGVGFRTRLNCTSGSPLRHIHTCHGVTFTFIHTSKRHTTNFEHAMQKYLNYTQNLVNLFLSHSCVLNKHKGKCNEEY